MSSILRFCRRDPLIGGVSIRNTRMCSNGTLGAIVLDAASKRPLGLSNHHVFLGANGKMRDEIIQPALSFRRKDVIGTVIRWDENLDCAVCSLNRRRRVSRKILAISQKVLGVKAPFLGMRVMKSGCRTGKTFGRVDSVGFDDFIIVPDSERPSFSGEISDGGDSGSIWLEAESSRYCYAVGLHYAGEAGSSTEERAYAIKMSKVVGALNITF